MNPLNALTKRTTTRDVSIFLLGSISIFFGLACILELSFLKKTDEYFLKNQATTITDNITGIIAKPLWELDRDAIASILDQYDNFEQVISIRVLDEHNKLIANFSKKSVQPQFSHQKSIYYDKALVGKLEVDFSATIPSKQKTYTVIALLTLVGLLFTCLFTTIFVIQYLLRKPFLQIISRMESIASGKAAQDLELPPQTDLAQIIKQTNTMAKAISNRERRLTELNNAISSLTRATSVNDLIKVAGEILLNVSAAKLCSFTPHEDAQIELAINKFTSISVKSDDYDPSVHNDLTAKQTFQINYNSRILGYYDLVDCGKGPEAFVHEITTIVSLVEELIAKLQVVKLNMMNMAELKVAQSVQEGMLLATSPDINQVQLAFLYKPMSRVGGDWFRVWSSPDEEHIYIMMGDVTGHGIGSGLVTTAVNGALQTLEYLVKENQLNFSLKPENIMDTLNYLLRSISGSSNLHMTCIIAKISVKTDELTLCNAGHTFPLIINSIDATTVTALTKHQQPMLGEEFSKDHRYQSARYLLKDQEYLLLYTDGLLETQDNKKQAFSRSFVRTLRNMDKISGPDNLKQTIDSKLSAHCQDVGVQDDICLAILQKIGA